MKRFISESLGLKALQVSIGLEVMEIMEIVSLLTAQ
jgi:hypothetical protein